ncbi:MAG TPA: TIGR01777 family oxidoreductase [Acidobacteriota bacterium]|nr:TIGR01777 family oxidoreductase [Acidobacteriota bacterium]HQG90066.1 TIGR01777 family oxidoreductase [Acidobacteriota bacterium]
MRTDRFVHSSRIEVPAEFAFAWHERPGALERLTPPWDRVAVRERAGSIHDGDRVVLALGAGPLQVEWEAVHEGYAAGREFRDVQRRGPFARWVHTHRFEPDGPAAVKHTDSIEYALPLGAVGRVLGGGAVRRRLARTFAHRHAVLAADLAAHWRWRDRSPRRIAVSGANGFVGSALTAFLTAGGHEVVRLGRHPAPGVIAAGTGYERLRPEDLAGVDAVVHLAGESIAAGRWTAARRERIRASRTGPTARLAEVLAAMPMPPAAFLCASAVGIYGDTGDAAVDESGAAAKDFLASVVRDWEAAAAAAAAAGIRAVNLRFGVVLGAAGGLLARLLTPFRLGLGGRLGSGRQYMSWIARDDVVGAIHHALMDPDVIGPVNVTAPTPVTNADFTRTLATVLRRPAVLPVPAAALRLAFGELADALMLYGQRALPGRLLAAGYVFRFPDLESALRHELGRIPYRHHGRANTKNN